MAIVRDFRHAGLEPVEVAMMEYAEKLALNAHEITQEDVDKLRQHGLSDQEILDVALVAGSRSFIAKLGDATGLEPDAEYLELEPEFRRALAVGHSFGES